MSKYFIELPVESGAKEVKDLSVLASAGTTNGVTFAEGNEITFGKIEETPFVSSEFNGTTVYKIGCKVNGVNKWIPLGSFRKRPLNYGDWIVSPELKVNKDLCEAGNDLELARLLCARGKLKCVGRTDAEIAKEFVEDPVTKKRSIKKDADGNYITRTVRFPVWQFGE